MHRRDAGSEEKCGLNHHATKATKRFIAAPRRLGDGAASNL